MGSLFLLLILLIALAVPLTPDLRRPITPITKASPAYEDFTTFTEVDPQGMISVGSSTYVTLTNLNGYYDAYLYKDYGPNHFTDFTHYVDVKLTGHLTGNAGAYVWALANVVDDWQNTGDTLGLQAHWQQSTSTYRLILKERYSGVTYTSIYTCSAATWYYLKIVKVGTSLSAYIYSDPSHTNLIQTLSLTLHADLSNRYLYAVQSNDLDSGSEGISCEVRNLDIGNGGVPESDFTHELDTKFTGHDAGTATLNVWALANVTGEWQASGDAVCLRFKWEQASSSYKITLKTRYQGETIDGHSTATLSGDTWYYLKIVKAGTSLDAYIYSDAARTVEVDHLNVTMQFDAPFTHTYAFQSNNYGYTDWLSVDIANLNLGGGTEDYTAYTEVDPNSRITVTSSLLQVNEMTRNEDAYVYKSTAPPGGGASFTNVQVTDRVFWKCVSWTSNVTADHRVRYSLNSDLSNPSFSGWDSGTLAPKIYISSELLKPQSTYYYRAETYIDGELAGQDSIRSLTTTLTAGVMHVGGTLITDEYRTEAPQNMNNLLFWNGYDNKWYLFEQGVGGSSITLVSVYSSTDMWHWEYEDLVFSSTPSGTEIYKKMYAWVDTATGEHLFTIGLDLGAGTGTGLWSGTSFVGMTYEGLISRYGDKPELTKNCRVSSWWYNETDSRWYGFIGGSTSTKGSWGTVYLARSPTLNFTGYYDPSPQYTTSDWDSPSWTSTWIFSPSGIWIGGKYFGTATGVGSGGAPDDKDVDLVFGDAPRSIDASTHYSSTSAAEAYVTSVIGIAYPKLGCIVNKDGLWMLTSEQLAPYDSMLVGFSGFWIGQQTSITSGYMPRFNYPVAPTEAQFKAIQDIMIYVWDDGAEVTLNQLSGTAPVYASFTVDGTSGDTIWVNIKDLTTNTVKLYRDGGYIKDVSPTGDDFLFSTTLTGTPNVFTLEGEGAVPTVTTQAATGIGWDDGTFHATLHGTITDTGGENCDLRGFDWDYDSGAPYAYSWTEGDSYGAGDFSRYVSGLTGETVYFRAKAHNSVGWGYGGELSFPKPSTENNPPNPPTLNNPAAGSRWDLQEYVTFSWTFSDPDTGGTQGAYQLQIDDNGDFSSPISDTGKVSSGASSCNRYLPDTMGLYYWRVRNWDNYDAMGDWSASRTIIVDGVIVHSLVSDDGRRPIGTVSTITVHLHHEYDGSNINLGSFTLNGLALTSQGNGDWITTHSRSTTQAVTFNNVFGSSGNLDYVNMNGKSTTVIWDIIHATYTTVSDARANLGAAVNIDWTLKYDYDETSVTDGSVSIEGHLATHLGGGVWRIIQSKNSVQAVTYDEFTASGNAYGIDVVDAAGHSETVIWDRWVLTDFWASSYTPQIGTPVKLYAKGKLDYDGHEPDGDDALMIEGIEFTWDENKGWFSATVSSGEEGPVTYDDLTSISEQTYGITVGTMGGLSVTLEWGNYAYQYTFYGLYSEDGSRAGSVDVTAHTSSGTFTYRLDGSLMFGLNERPDMFSFPLSGGGNRFLFTYGGNETMYVFTPDGDYASYGFTVRDYIGVVGSGVSYLESLRAINGTEHLIERQLIWDTSNPVPLMLTKGRIYMLQIRLPDGSVHRFGYFLAGEEPTPTLNIMDLPFSDQAQLPTRYITLEALRPTYTHIRVNYEDDLGETSQVQVEVKLKNGMLAWNDTASGFDLKFNWFDAVNTTDYVVWVRIDHPRLGELSYSWALAGASAGFPPPPDLGIFGEWPIDPPAVLSIFLIFVVAGAFSAASAPVGVFAAAATAAILAYLGWLDVPYATLGVAIAMAVMIGLMRGGGRR